MSSGENLEVLERKVKPGTFQSGPDPRRGRGAPAGVIGPRRAAERKIRERVINDLVGELRQYAGQAVDTLVALLDNEDETIRLRSAESILSRTFGTPVSTQVLQATVTNIDEVRRPNLELLQAAARRLLAASAVDASEVGE